MSSLESYWYKPNKIVWLLLPLSWFYCLISQLRRKLYQLNIKKSYAVDVPVVVVGNIVAGGSGKTPLLIALCELVKSKGFKAGVVSRGYDGTYTGVRQLSATDTASVVGDEPLMISQRTGVPVVVGVDRVAAVKHLLDNNACDVVFSDDGLQHYKMRRTLELAVVDAQRQFGNGFCIPAGPLRERVSRLKQVDMVIYSGKTDELKSDIASQEYSYQLKISKIQSLNGDECRELSDFSEKQVHAVAGIGNPTRFFQQLETEGISVIAHAFADHYHYRQEDFSGWSDDCILMTEKDAVKCQHLSLDNAWVIMVDSELSLSLKNKLEQVLLPLISKN